ncbi:MAG: hypothetical protein ACRD2W_25675 [Acidimicrobiales bacterium]
MTASDQEGIYEGLQWALRALDKCGRAFTRLAGRTTKVECRLGAIESTVAARTERPDDSPLATSPDVVHGLAAFDERLRKLEAGAGRTPTAVVPLRVDAQLSILRKDLAATQLRLARLEEVERRHSAEPTPPPAATPAPMDSTPPTVALAARVGSLEADIQGLYRELDTVAELVADRFATLGERIEGIVATRELNGSPPAAPPAAAPAPADVSPDLATSTVRAKAATVLIGELERICHALGVLSEVADPAG